MLEYTRAKYRVLQVSVHYLVMEGMVKYPISLIHSSKYARVVSVPALFTKG